MPDLTGLVSALRLRAGSAHTQSDMSNWKPLPEPATTAKIAAAESRLGFALPSVVSHVYGQVANGGFGPGYGLIGIGGGRRGFANAGRRWFCEDEYLNVRADPEITWPAGALPVVDWGCAIYSCVDATQPDAPMLRAFCDLLYDDPPIAVTPMNCTFTEWLQAWVDGQDLWKALNAW
jgi:hypothetical protein